MEGGQQMSPQLGYQVDSSDAKYVSGLSTILVATIQEAKDRISQIEYIFCSQLFPNFQSKSKTLQKLYSEAMKAAEDAWKEKEKDLLLQIEKLQFEKQQALEENQSLKLDKAKLEKTPSSICSDELQEELEQKTEEVKELVEKNDLLGKNMRCLEVEANGVMEQKDKLLQLVQSKVSLIGYREKQLKEQEEKTAEISSKLKSMKEKVDELQEQLDEKAKHVDAGKELQEYLIKKIELQASEMEEKKQLLIIFENEKRLLRKKLGDQVEEVEERREMLEKELKKLQKEKKMLMGEIEVLEENVSKLQRDLRERSNDSTKGTELHEKLLQQIGSKHDELLSEKKKRRDLIDAYKKLKSQYNFLCAKFGLTTENMLPQNRAENGRESSASPGIEHNVQNNSVVACMSAGKNNNQENLENNRGLGLVKPSSSFSPSSGSPKYPTTAKPAPLAGTKRPGSNWIETRSHQNRNGPDPHDDFLDTPLDTIRGNLKKSTKQEVPDIPEPVPKDMNIGSSDDETQDLNVDPAPQKQQMPPPRSGTRGFKYVESVRKKAERDNLKGIECKQCKKFYDAVLPDGDADGNKQNLRCEHHDGVSRHRYRYAPPLTPEGFWNIGFESEM